MKKKTYKQLITQLKKDLIQQINDYPQLPFASDEDNYCILLKDLRYVLDRTIYNMYVRQFYDSLHHVRQAASPNPLPPRIFCIPSNEEVNTNG